MPITKKEMQELVASTEMAVEVGSELSEQLDRVLNDVARERQRQDSKWGGATNDDQWTPLDWHEMIADYNGWARRMACMGSPDKARNRYIQLAALAVAAVEAIDRRTV